MPSVKQLKKDINDSIGALIEEIYGVELEAPKVDSKKADAIIDAAISLFDELIGEITCTCWMLNRSIIKIIHIVISPTHSLSQ